MIRIGLAASVLPLVATGRRSDAGAMAPCVPDWVVLFGRLALLREHWPGPAAVLDVMLRLAGPARQGARPRPAPSP